MEKISYRHFEQSNDILLQRDFWLKETANLPGLGNLTKRN